MNWVRLNLPDGTKVQLTAWNTHIFIHAAQFAHIDHVFVRRDDETGMFIFNNRELLRLLMDSENYPYSWAPFPADEDIEAYERFRRNNAIDVTPKITESEIDSFVEQLELDIDWDELGGE